MSCNCTTTELEGGRVKYSDYYSEIQPTWCSGCGDYAIMAALKRSLVELDIAPSEVVLCFDVGCNSNMNDKLGGYRVHTLHGRVLPFAAGAKISHPKLKVIAFAGDGATYSEGLNHFINSLKSNYPITFFVHNNGNYGLTTGQASATTPQNTKRTANPDGPTSMTLNPLELALSIDPAFVGRSTSADIGSLIKIMKQAISFQDEGFAYVDILQACPTYNRELTHEMLLKRSKNVEDFPDYNPNNLAAARAFVQSTGMEIANGVIYKNPNLVSYLKKLVYRKKSWSDTTLREEVKKYSISDYLNSLS